MSDLLFETRAALHLLRRSPGFCVVAVSTLALGIGAATCMFAAVDAWILKPLPYPHSGDLVAIHETSSSGRELGVSKDDLRDILAQSRTLQMGAAVLPRTFGLADEGAPIVVLAGMFTRDLFGVLGFAPALGRPPEPQDELPGRTKVAWLSDALWRKRFGSDRAVVGKTLTLNEESYLISGVLPAGCAFPLGGRNPDLYIPLDGYEGRAVRTLTGVGRLAPSVPMPTAAAEMRGLAARLAAIAPNTNAGVGLSLRPLHEELLGNRGTSLLLLMGGVFVLLVIACSSVANLLLTRSVLRAHDVAVRVSLGATRGHIFRQYLIEALCLSLTGGLAGVALGLGGLSLFQFLPQFLPTAAGIAQLRPATMDWSVVSFAVVVSILIALVFALVPISVVFSSAPSSALHSRGLSGNTRRVGSTLRNTLVAAQIAMSVVLLLNGGVLLRSFLKLLYRSPGFESENVVSFGLGLPEVRYSSDLKLLQFHTEVLRLLTALPTVQSAGAIWGLPLSGKGPLTAFDIEGEMNPGTQRHVATVATASGGYFETLHIPLLAGRTFGSTDGPHQPAVVLVNETFARTYFGGRSAIGRRILFGWNNEWVPKGTMREIVGIVGDTRQQSLDAPVTPQLYLPIGQSPPDGLYYVARTPLPPSTIAGALRQAIRSIDPALEDLDVRPLSAWISAALTDRRATVVLLLVFAAAALFVSAVGVFGAISYNVGTQVREIAIRLALGATPASLVAAAVFRGLRPIFVGIAMGLIGAYWTGQFIKAELIDVTLVDPTTLMIVLAVLGTVALVASVRPSIRVASIDPMVVLREE